MKEAGAPIAGERSGHIFLKDGFHGYDDGLFAGLRLAEYVSQAGKPLSRLLAEAPQYVTSPEIHVDCADEVKYGVVDRLTAELERDHPGRVNDVNGARVTFDDGWGLVRASSNLPELVLVFEGRTAARDGRGSRTEFRPPARAHPEIGRVVAQRVSGGAARRIGGGPGGAGRVGRRAAAGPRGRSAVGRRPRRVARGDAAAARASRSRASRRRRRSRFDEHGVPHVRAATEADAFRALGACHALDRFFQMDMTRRVLSGRLVRGGGGAVARRQRAAAALGGHDARRRPADAGSSTCVRAAAASRSPPRRPEERALLDAYVAGRERRRRRARAGAPPSSTA